MKLRKNHLIKATALCAAAMMSCTMLSTADANAFRSVSLLAVAEEEAWTLSSDGTLTISQNIREKDIPWADQLDKIKKVVAADEVDFLPNRAFEGCTNLTSAKLPDALNCVTTYMFAGCTSLTEVHVPASAFTIYEGAFKGCTALKSITLPEKISSVLDESFRDCTSLTEISFPEKHYIIGSYAFSGCTSLKDVSFSEYLNVVGCHAFEGTPWLKAQQEKSPFVIVNKTLIDATLCTGDVVIPDGVLGTGGAFADTDITSVTFGDAP